MNLMITTRCPVCLQLVGVADEFAGRQGRCPRCDYLVEFPAAPAQALIFSMTCSRAACCWERSGPSRS